MPAVADRSCWRSWPRVAVLGVLAAAIAGCSADTTRFGNPNASPYASRSAAPGAVTGSVRAPTSAIAAQPLPPPPASHSPSIASSGVSGGAPGLGSYAPPPAAYRGAPSARDITGTVPHPQPVMASGATVHVVIAGETLMSLSRHYHKPLSQIAAANNIPPDTRLRVGDRVVIPGTALAARPARPTLAAAAPRLQPPPPAPAPAPIKVADAAPAARIATAGPQATAEAGASGIANAGAPSFRWPVRGRVITAFGPRSNGQQSDGIDLAVPEGTAVRAAEDGVVAYAGNELKGYGNLILIRHANGFVTAYAHASEIMVKRNDTVRRGQVIAKSGQTGNVSSPELHFEIRKGSSPVDPTLYLPSGA